MPKILKMPTEAELPKGPWRDFVEALFIYYRAADRPDLRAIQAAVETLNEDMRPGTASRETIRQMLRGRTVARQWGTVATVLCALCALARIDPNAHADGVGGFFSDDSHLNAFKKLWHNASDVPRTLSEAARNTAKARRIMAASAATSRTTGDRG